MRGKCVVGKCICQAESFLKESLLSTVAEDRYEPLVSAMGGLLDHILSTAKKSLGVTVRHNTLLGYASLGCFCSPMVLLQTSRVYATVPAYFNDAEKRATSDIYEVAGYKVERVTSEPVAGAFFVLSQDHLQSSDTRGVLVVDKGGGTLDITILEQTPGKACCLWECYCGYLLHDHMSDFCQACRRPRGRGLHISSIGLCRQHIPGGL